MTATLLRRGPSGPPVDIYPVDPAGPVSVLDYLTGTRTMVQAINAAFADPEPEEVFFPPGDYTIDGQIASNLANKVLYFVPGSVLNIVPSGTTTMFAVNGANSKIEGDPLIRFGTASAAAFTALDLHGAGSSCGDIRFEPNVNVTNCTLFKVSGDYSTVGETTIEGVGEFLRGLDLIHQDATALIKAVAGRIRFFPTDDGITTRTYESILRMAGANLSCGGLAMNTGGRTRISQVIDCNVSGLHSELYNPQITAANADYGIRMRANSEFLNVFGGQIVGGYLAASQGISCGALAGQLKLYGTKITNWDFGLRFTGSCDAPLLCGATIANNKTANLEIDSTASPISGLCLCGVYMESVAFPLCVPMNFKTGLAPGVSISGCQLSSSDAGVAMIEVAVGFGGGDIDLRGNRFPQVAGASVIRPNVNTKALFGANSFSGSNSISVGAFAANAQDYLNPNVTTLQVSTSSKLGTAGDLFLQDNNTYFTVNYGAGIAALTAVELDFSWSEAITNRLFTWGLSGTLAANTSLLFFAYVKSAGTFTVRAYNVTAVNVGAISGTIFVRSTKVPL